MSIQQRRHQRTRAQVPAIDWLDEFGDETAPSQPSSRGLSHSSDESLPLFDIVEAELASEPRPRTARRSRRPAPPWMAAVAVAAAAVLGSGVLLGAGQLASALRRQARAPVAVQSSSSPAAVVRLATSLPPVVLSSQSSAPVVHKAPAVYRIPSPEPPPPPVDAVTPTGADIDRFRQALDTLVGHDAGLEHCGMRATSPEHVVAVCRAASGERSEWTLDLSRSGAGWQREN